MEFPRPDGKPAFTADWFLWFAHEAGLTLPEGTRTRIEGHTILMTREFFAPELVHLLVVIPKNNQKTVWEALLADWHLLTVPAPRVYMGAADKEQAKELYSFATHFINSEPELAKHLLVRDSTLEIRRRDGTGGAKVLASDDSKGGGKKQGKNFTLGEIDELHAHENDNLFTDFRSAGFKRRDAAKVAGLDWWWMVGKLATITTAGFDKESALYRELIKFLGDPEHGTPPMGTVETRMRVLPNGSVVSDPEKGRLTIARYGEGRNVLLHWACEPEDDPEDFEVVKWANPASTVTMESLKDARESLTPWAYQRYRMNRWTLGFESWIPVGSWDALAEVGVDLDPELPLWAALDMARYRDCAALVAVQPREDRPTVVKSWIWRPGGVDDPVPYSVVYEAARALHRDFDLRGLAIDGKYLDEMYETLSGEGIVMEMFPQSPERMCPAAANLRKAILEKRLAFDPHDEHAARLSMHIMAPVPKETPQGFKLDKSRRNGPDIDAAEALSMALAIAGDDSQSMYEDEDAII